MSPPVHPNPVPVAPLLCNSSDLASDSSSAAVTVTSQVTTLSDSEPSTNNNNTNNNNNNNSSNTNNNHNSEQNTSSTSASVGTAATATTAAAAAAAVSLNAGRIFGPPGVVALPPTSRLFPHRPPAFVSPSNRISVQLRARAFGPGAASLAGQAPAQGQLRDVLFSGHPHHRPSFSSHVLQSLSHGHEGGENMDATFMWKLSKLGRIGSSRLRFDDDFSDRLNYQFTGVLLFLFIGLIGIRQYVGKPIQCFIPQEFSRGWEEYAENYCWVSNTYFAPVQNRLPAIQERSSVMIKYYQWAPIVLAIQALMFYIPCLIWRLFMGYSGFNVRKILQMACDSNILVPEALNKNIRFMSRYMEGCIYRQREYRKGVSVRLKHCLAKCTCLFCGKRYGNYLVVLYFFVKVLYLLNIFGQIYMMERFIGTNYTFYGVQVLHDLTSGKEWYNTGHFPRVTFCDFAAKKLGKNYAYTLQCVLPLNMFLEKIYIFLWFWHILVGLVTLASFVNWFLRMAFSRRRLNFVRKYLKILNVLKDTDKTTSRKFVENYLRPDGVFIIRLIAINCGDIIAGDLACELWSIYRHKRLQELDDAKVDDTRLPGFVLNSNGDRNSDDNIV